MEAMDIYENEIDLKELLYMLIKRWWVIAITTLIALFIGAGYTFFIISPTYRASTTLFVGQNNNQEFTLNSESLNVNSKLMGDYRELAKSKVVMTQVLNDLNLNIELATLRDNIEVKSLASDTRMFSISYKGSDPQEITLLVNTIAHVLIQKAKDLVLVENIQVVDLGEIPTNPIGSTGSWCYSCHYGR